MITTDWVDSFAVCKRGQRVNKSFQTLETRNLYEGAPLRRRKFFFFKERDLICDDFIVMSCMFAHDKSSFIAVGFGDGTFDLNVHTLDNSTGWWGVMSDGNIMRNGHTEFATRPLVPGDCVTLIFDKPRQILHYFLNEHYVCVMQQVMAQQPLASLGFVSLPDKDHCLQRVALPEKNRCLLRLLQPEEVKIDLGHMRIKLSLCK